MRRATAEVAPPPDLRMSSRLIMSRAATDFLRSTSLPAELSLLISAVTATVCVMPAIGFSSRLIATVASWATTTPEIVEPS